MTIDNCTQDLKLTFWDAEFMKEYVNSKSVATVSVFEKSKRWFGIIPEELGYKNFALTTMDWATARRHNWSWNDPLCITLETEPLGFSAFHEVNS